MDCIVHWVTKSQTQVSNSHFHFHFTFWMFIFHGSYIPIQIPPRLNWKHSSFQSLLIFLHQGITLASRILLMNCLISHSGNYLAGTSSLAASFPCLTLLTPLLSFLSPPLVGCINGPKSLPFLYP